MKFGLLFRVQDPPNAEHIGDRWQEALKTAQVAEESGFDGVFLPEHHMMPDGYLPSQWPVLGALAAVTERLELGTTVHLLPFEHPIHVAEHGAMVDILSDGRLRLGCGMGNFPEEFELYGLNPKTQVSRFEEAIDIVQRAWAGENIDHEGKHFKIKGHISPLPVGARAMARCHVRARRPPRGPLRLPVADRPASQRRRHEVLDRHLPGSGRGVRHLRQARRGAAARRLGGRLARRGGAGLVAVHPQRALVLLREGAALGGRP